MAHLRASTGVEILDIRILVMGAAKAGFTTETRE
jgi:hypothetical protein